MAEENIEIEVSGFKGLRAQIREATLEYQKLLEDVNSTPELLQAAATKVGKLKDELGDAADTAKALATVSGRFEAATKGLAAISGGFTAIKGAMAAFGSDTKDFEKTFERLQGAMALTQGLTALGEAKDAFSNLGKVGVQAFQSIKSAIGSTGIGLLVIALGTIYAYWDDIKAVVSGVSEEQEQLNAKAEANVTAEKAKLDSLNGQDNILKLQGKTEKEILQLKVSQIDAVIKATEIQLLNQEATKKAQVEAAKRNQDILKGALEFVSLPLTALLKGVDAIGSAFGKNFGLLEKFTGGVSKLIFDPEKVEKDGDETIKKTKESLDKLKNDRAGFQLQIKAIDDKAAADAKDKRDKQKEDQKKANEDQLKIQEDHLKKTKDLENQYAVDSLQDQQNKDSLALEQRQKAQQDELALLIKSYEDKKKLTEQEEKTLAILKKEQIQLGITQAQEVRNLADKQAKETEKKNYDDSLKLLQQSNAEKNARLDQQYADGLILLKDYEKKQREDQVQFLKEQFELAEKDHQDSTAAKEAYYKALADKRKADLEDEKSAREAKNKITNAELDLAAQAGEFLQQIAGKNKQLAITGIIISQAAAIGKVIANTAAANAESVAAFPLTAGMPWVAINTASAALSIASTIAAAAKSISEINSQSPESGGKGGSPSKPTASKFGYGGLLTGPKHAEGGIMTPMGELEGGEYVVNRSATAAFLPLLNQINARGGSGVPNNTSSIAENSGSQQIPIIKTYVVASEVSSQMEANKKIQDIAKL